MTKDDLWRRSQQHEPTEDAVAWHVHGPDGVKTRIVHEHQLHADDLPPGSRCVAVGRGGFAVTGLRAGAEVVVSKTEPDEAPRRPSRPVTDRSRRTGRLVTP